MRLLSLFRRLFVFAVAAAGVLLACSGAVGAVESVPPLPVLPASYGVVSVAPRAGSDVLRPLPKPRGGAFNLRYVGVGQLVDLLYGDVMRVPHVISSDVLSDTRLVSFQYDGSSGGLHDFVKVFLDSQGFDVQTRDGVDFVVKKPPEVANQAEQVTFVYRPRFRPADYLAKLLRPLFSGRMTASDGLSGVMPSPGVGAAVVGVSGASAVPVVSTPVAPFVRPGVVALDDLVFVGSAAEIRDVKQLLPQLDRAPGEVVVRGWVYEVSVSDSANSAFSIAADVLRGIGGRLSLSSGSTDQDPTALRFTSGYLDVAISALNADSRFKQVSDPHVRVVSGADVRLNVGSQVPTLGSISYQGVSGTPVQSVDYQDAGLIFDVRPVVMADAVQVQLQEQMSSFVSTTTGVNNSPTKNTRQMSTTVSMHDGEVIVIGGLVQDTDSAAHNSTGWLPHFLDGRSSSKGRTEVLLVLQVQKVF